MFDPLASTSITITPNSYLPGAAEITKLLGGLASWALYACLAAFILGGAIWGFSVRAGNFTQAHKGRDLLLGGLIGAVVVGAASTFITFGFNAGHAVK